MIAPGTSPVNPEPDGGLAQALEQYLAALEAGTVPDREAFLAAHPHLADELRECLASLELIRVAACGPLALDKGGAAGPDHPLGRLGDFVIVREVGRGGMGVVYEAEQLSLGRRVALKVLPFASRMDPRQLQRFQNEARAAACLHHPNIVPVYGVGSERSVHFYAMQLIDGVTVAEVIARQGGPAPRRGGGSVDPAAMSRGSARLPTLPDLLAAPEQPTARAAEGSTEWPARDRASHHRVAEWGIQAAEALEHAHGLGVVHRDIKPANLIVDGQGTLWVTDFGLARFGAGADLTLTGDVLGTLRYMSPEQALARHDLVDHRTDIYSLGVTLYELLTLRPAVAGDDRAEVLRQLVSAEPLAPRQLDAAIPRDLETVVQKAMAREPAERYQTAQELADDLRRFLQDQPIRARRPAWSQRLRRWARRNRTVVWSAALVAGLLLALSPLVVWLVVTRAQEREQRDVAQKLAQTEEFYRLLFTIKERQARKEPGWTWDNQRDIARAVALPAAAENLAGLRSEALACLAGGDLRLNRTLAEGFTAYHVAFSPDGKMLALVQGIGDSPAPMRVRLFDPVTGRERPGLTFPSNSSGQDRIGLAECVYALRFSPDGCWLAAGTRTGMLHAWDLKEAAPRARSWAGHPGRIKRVAFSGDSTCLFSLGIDGIIKGWDARRGWAALSLANATGVADLVPLPPDQVVACRTDRRLGVVGPEGVDETIFRLPDNADLVGASSDGRTLAVHHHDDELYLHDFAQVSRPLGKLRDSGGDDREDGVAFSPDGRFLARASGMNRRLRLWDVASGRLLASVPVLQGHQSVAFSPDGRLVAVTAKGQSFLYELSDSLEQVVAHHGGKVHDVVFARDGRGLASLAESDQGKYSHVSFWPLDRGDSLRPAAVHLNPLPALRCLSLALHPDGQTAFFQANDELRCWRPQGGGLTLCGPLVGDGQLCCGPDGRLWAASHHEVRSGLSPRDGLATCWTNSAADQSAGLAFHSVTVGRRWALAGRRDGKVFLFDAATARYHASWSVCRSSVQALALNSDEGLALAGSKLGKVSLLEVPSGRVVLELPPHRRAVTGVGFAGPDLLVTVSLDDEVKLWRRDGERLLTLPAPGPVQRLAISPDGTRLALAIQNERAVRLWRLNELAERLARLGLPLEGAEPPPRASPPPPARDPPPASPQGLKAELFAGANFNVKIGDRIDARVDLHTGTPGWEPLSPDYCSVRWTGWLKAPEQGKYVLRVHHDDGVHLWLDGRRLLDYWGVGGAAHEVTVTLTDRPHALRLDYWKCFGPGCCALLWRREGHTRWEVIPPTALFHDHAAAAGAVAPLTPRVEFAVQAGRAGSRAGGSAVAVDPRSGDVYVLGTFEGQVDFGSGPGKVGFASAGGRDGFVARYTPTGKLVWACRFGGLGPDGLEGVAVDAKGAVYVVGYFHGAAAFCPEAGGERLATKPGGQAALVAKLDSAGRVLWARHVVGGAGENRAYGIALDGRDGVYVTGRFSGRADFGPGSGAFVLESRGEADLFVWKLTQAGQPIWVRRMGGSGPDGGLGIAVDPRGDILVSGWAASPSVDGNFPGEVARNTLGPCDALVMKLTPDGGLIWLRQLGGNEASLKNNVVTADSAGNVYVLGQLSGMIEFKFIHDRCVIEARPGPYLVKLDPRGSTLWARAPWVGCPGASRCLAADRLGGLLWTGQFSALAHAGHPPAPSPEDRLLLLEASPDGHLRRLDWAGGKAQVEGAALAVDGKGGVYITGTFRGTADFDPEPGKLRRTAAGEWDFFLWKRSAPPGPAQPPPK